MKDEAELPLQEAPRWTVEPVYEKPLRGKKKKKGNGRPRQAALPVIKHHELRYDGRRRDIGTTEREVERLRDMAKLFNSKGATPKQVTKSGYLQLDLFPELTPPPRKIEALSI